MTIYNILDTSGVISILEDGLEVPAGATVIGQTSDPNYLLNLVPAEALITKFAFLQRFTETELVAIELAKIHDPAASSAQNLLAATLRMHQVKLDASKWVDLAHNETVTGVQGLETAGLLAAGRAAEILEAPIGDDERA